MPGTHYSTTRRVVTASANVNASTFPGSHHLIVTTPGHVHTIKKDRSREIFRSGSRGILAATEAKDASGTLAISDSSNVILHRIEDGLERSYRLKGSEGQIRLLEFSADSTTLFFATTILNAVQAYSVAEARLLEPGPLHSSMPTVIAISPLSHTLLTASEEPPSIYLQNRALGTQPLLLQPLASQAPAVKACFHPDRPNVFLLAFKDGTVAAYDATRLFRSYEEGAAYPQAVGGELHVFRALHAVSSKRTDVSSDAMLSATLVGADHRTRNVGSGARALSITGAAFLPGSKSQAVTCGADGKCRLIDFDKATIVHSWHVRAPATSLSILPSKTGKTPLVAVGKVDGKVAIYDLSGALLREFVIDEATSDPIIGVEWVKGPGPQILDDKSKVKRVEETWIELYAEGGSLRSRKTRSSEESTALESPVVHPPDHSLTGHIPTAAESNGTVCHRPSDNAEWEHSPPKPGHNYMDLFSPVKTDQPRTEQPAQKPRRRSTPRNRPRISSSTFVNHDFKPVSPSSPRGPVSDHQITTHNHAAPPLHPSPVILPTSSPSAANDSSASRLLMGIKQSGKPGARRDVPGSFALFAPYMPQAKGTIRKKPVSNRRSSRVSNLALLGFSPKKSSPVKKQKARERTGEEDIWLTAESESDDAEASKRGDEKLRRSRTSRRLMWPNERAKSRQVTEGVEIEHRPSIELAMSPPVAKALNRKTSRERGPFAGANQTPSEIKPSSIYSKDQVASSVTSITSTTSLSQSDTYDETILPESSLRPGFAQSYQGPVSVNRYLPRKSSLAFPSSPPPDNSKRRSIISEVSGNEQGLRENETQAKVHDELTCQCCSKTRGEIAALKAELVELRKVLKGKGRGS